MIPKYKGCIPEDNLYKLEYDDNTLNDTCKELRDANKDIFKHYSIDIDDSEMKGGGDIDIGRNPKGCYFQKPYCDISKYFKGKKNIMSKGKCKDKLLDGKSCTPECKDALHKPEAAVCSKDGVLTTIPQCKKYCPLPQNTFKGMKDRGTCRAPYLVHGEACELKCHPGHTNKPFKCNDGTMGGGCIPNKCIVPIDLQKKLNFGGDPGKNFAASQSNNWEIEHGKTGKFSCKNGYSTESALMFPPVQHEDKSFSLKCNTNKEEYIFKETNIKKRCKKYCLLNSLNKKNFPGMISKGDCPSNSTDDPRKTCKLKCRPGYISGTIGCYDGRIWGGCIQDPKKMKCEGADIDRNKNVNIEDLLIILGGFGKKAQHIGQYKGDIDNNKKVDIEDLLKLLSNYGKKC